MKTYALFLIFLMFSVSAQSMECQGPTIDLSGPKGSLHPLRITNQNGLGICHIEQLHKLLKAELPGHPDLSRIQMAMAEKRNRDLFVNQKNAVRWTHRNGSVGGTFLDAGSSCTALNYLKGQSICLADDDRVENLSRFKPNHQEKILEALSLFFDEREKEFKQNFISVSLKTAKIICAQSKNYDWCIIDSLKKSTQHDCISSFGKAYAGVVDLYNLGMTAKEIMNALEFVGERDTYFASLLKCEGRVVKIPKTLNCKLVSIPDLAKKSDSPQKFESEVSSMIDLKLKQNRPVGISSCTRFFKNPKSKVLDRKTGKFTCGDKTDPHYAKDEGSHAVTIIGSRCRNGKKEYLIQNSWGSGCFYSADYQCTKKGGFWAPADVISYNVRSLHFME